MAIKTIHKSLKNERGLFSVSLPQDAASFWWVPLFQRTKEIM
jgi:hypothetical protein